MLRPSFRKQVERGLVTLLSGGRGFLAASNFILTAEHCVRYEPGGGLVLGDVRPQDIRSAAGAIFRLGLAAVESVSDVAVLTALDGSEPAFLRDVAAFEQFCEETSPLEVCLERIAVGGPFPVYGLDHFGEWVEMTAQRISPNLPMLWIEASRPVSGGASGGPVLNERGQVLALVSNFLEDSSATNGSAPVLSEALPVWVIQRLAAAQRGSTRPEER